MDGYQRNMAIEFLTKIGAKLSKESLQQHMSTIREDTIECSVNTWLQFYLLLQSEVNMS
jgi:hypothetical protein